MWKLLPIPLLLLVVVVDWTVQVLPSKHQLKLLQ